MSKDQIEVNKKENVVKVKEFVQKVYVLRQCVKKMKIHFKVQS